MKVFYKKQKPKVFKYRCYKKFEDSKFKNDLNNEFLNFDFNNGSFNEYKNIFMSVLDKHAPVKVKYVRANNSSFMNKTLRTAIMQRSKLKNRFSKQRTEANKKAYNKQRNLCVSLLRKSKKCYFGKLDNKNISNSKKFWKSVAPLFSEKSFQKESIILFENETYISEDNKVAEIFNNFFSNVVKQLHLDDGNKCFTNSPNISDPILKAIEKYETHSSILMIKDQVNNNNKNLEFSFNYVTKEKILGEINKLDATKSCQDGDIPLKIVMNNIDMFSNFLYNNLNNSLFSSIFPSEFKKADIIPIFKNKDHSNKENYRPISILPNLSKVYERCIYDQIYEYFDKILSSRQCGFRKGYNAQDCLLVMVENWRHSLDQGKFSGAIMTDLSKAFDCILHDLLIAKLAAYGFDYQSLKFIYSYITDRKQRTKINNSFSSYTKIDYGVPQGSVLGPLLFNIYICDMFYNDLVCDIVSYADDTTPYTSNLSLTNLLSNLENDTQNLFDWFSNNHMKANVDKCHLLVSCKDEVSVTINNFSINKTEEEKLLGIKLSGNLSFEKHVSSLCKKASQKLHALARIVNYMDLSKRKSLMKAFIISQFNYCPLVWMFHSRKLNNRINNIHERALRLVYKDDSLSFEELLVKDSSVTIHQRNIQLLATEIYKIINNISPLIMDELIQTREPPYNLRSDCNQFIRYNTRTTCYGIESINHLGPKIWNLVPQNLKDCDSLNKFKKLIKSWTPEKCPCKLCKQYIANIGFI